ncbi:MAG: hypothetical protein KJ886_01920 [Candidatus Thermoplasmatota archaeon]|nr:hypothetical protein [Candidatus Thermoplasmatota archaeon]MCG2825862.1 hypothetical protein [Thermoplasmatales archaeon]
MDEQQITQQSGEYYLLIEPIVTSKSKKFLLLFRPKEVILSEPCEIKLKITNKSGIPFCGGVLEGAELPFFVRKPVGTYKPVVTYGSRHETSDDFNQQIVPHIPVENNVTITLGNKQALIEGLAWIYVTVKSNDSKPIKYYQLDKLTGEQSLIEKDYWQDCFQVVSRYEIHQRYTNRLLIMLSAIMTIFMVLTLLKY